MITTVWHTLKMKTNSIKWCWLTGSNLWRNIATKLSFILKFIQKPRPQSKSHPLYSSGGVISTEAIPNFTWSTVQFSVLTQFVYHAWPHSWLVEKNITHKRSQKTEEVNNPLPIIHKNKQQNKQEHILSELYQFVIEKLILRGKCIHPNLD